MFRQELRARRDLFYRGISELAGDIFSGAPPAGAFYAFLRIDRSWNDASSLRHVEGRPEPGRGTTGSGRAAAESLSWRMVEYLIKNGRIGCVPGVDFGANGEGYIRFCFARERTELAGALESMRAVFAQS